MKLLEMMTLLRLVLLERPNLRLFLGCRPGWLVVTSLIQMDYCCCS